MKLNPDCVRDCLLAIEELPLASDYHEEEIRDSEYLTNYSEDDITYSLIQLIDAGFLEGEVKRFMQGSSINIKKITWDGHSFLENIRPESTWKKTKSTISEKVGSASLSIFSQVAAAMINAKLGL